MLARLLPLILGIAIQLLREKPNSKTVQFLTDEKTQNTVNDFVAAYTTLVEGLDTD